MKEYLTNFDNIERITIPEDKLNQAIRKGIKKGEKESSSIKRKVLYLSSVAVIIIGLGLSSNSMSTTFARMVSNIPELSSLFESPGIGSIIHEELEKNGYQIETTMESQNGYKKEVEIWVSGTTTYFENVKKDIKDLATSVLESNDYKGYIITLKSVGIPNKELVIKENKKVESGKNLLEEISKALAFFERSYTDQTIHVSLHFDTENEGKSLTVEIPDTETRKNEIEETILTLLESISNESIPVNFIEYSLEDRKQYSNWIDPIRGIREGLTNDRNNNITDVRYQVQDGVTFIYVQTNIDLNNEHSKIFSKEIENTILDYLKTSEIQNIINDDKYSIIVNSKDNHQLNN